MSKGNRDNEIKQGMIGFMVTCDGNKERRVIKECFNLLNAYVELLYPSLNFKEIKDEYD